MTTSVKVKSANYPALVIKQHIKDGSPVGDPTYEVLIPDDGERYYSCHTGMAITVMDIEYSDPRVPEHYRKA